MASGDRNSCPAAPLDWAPLPAQLPPSSSLCQAWDPELSHAISACLPVLDAEGRDQLRPEDELKEAGRARDKCQSREDCGVILGLTPSCRTFCAFSNLEGVTGGEWASACLLCGCPFLSAGKIGIKLKFGGPPKKKRKNRWELSGCLVAKTLPVQGTQTGLWSGEPGSYLSHK